MRGFRAEQGAVAQAREDSGSGCGGGGGMAAPPSRKRGLSRFSLRRLLYSSPLVPRRINRSTNTRHAPQHKPATPGREDRGSQSTTDGPSRDAERGEAGGGAVAAAAATAGVAATAAAMTPGASRGSSRPSYSASQAAEAAAVAAAGPESGAAAAAAAAAASGKPAYRISCPLCLFDLPTYCFPQLITCAHQSCYECFQKYLRVEISESRVKIACPECSEPMHPSDIRRILNDNTQFEKYEDFMVRRVLACDPDTRWCPAPDCSFAVIAAGCASCPKIKCERPGCDAHFCYHCKAEWHPNQTCDAARAQRSPDAQSSSVSFNQHSRHRDDIKPCPRCQVLIVKMDDGSCNHMTCAVCGAEFCWLCMKEVSDLHFLSPSGCTFWGKKPWSRKKKILWQLGTLVGAPVGIGLIAGIAVPAMIIGIPVWVGKKLYTRYESSNKHKRNLAIFGGVTAAVLVSPFLAALAVSIGAPVLLFYVYGVVPVSMCRSGGCGVSNSAVRLDLDDMDDLDVLSNKNTDGDAASHRGANPSIGEVSISLGSGSQLERLGREPDRESASNAALAGASLTGTSLAGSIASSLLPSGQRLEVQADVAQTQRFSMSSETASAATSLSERSVSASLQDDGAASTRALAGSVLNYKMDSVSGVVNVDHALDPLEEVGPPVQKWAEKPTSRRRSNLDRQTSDSGSADSAMGGSDDCVSMDRVRFDDNVSIIEAASPVCVSSNRAGREKAPELSAPVEGRNLPDKSNFRSLFFHSTSSSSNVDKRIPKFRKQCPHVEVDLSGIEISVDGKPLEVIPEPSGSISTPPNSPVGTVPSNEEVKLHCTLEIPNSLMKQDLLENMNGPSVLVADEFERIDV